MLGDFETPLWIPHYRDGRWGEWSLRIQPATAARGYWGRLYAIAGMPMLTGPWGDHGAAWMSMVPMEIESQEIGLAAACGHTVVLGLGMGWAAANAALNPAVEQVTVIERDPDVIALVERLGVFTQLPAASRSKLELAEADALRWRPDGPVHSLQADIWTTFVAPGRWEEVHRIQDNIGASSLYFWGQELELWRLACRAHRGVPEALGDDELRSLAADTGLPLVLDGSPGCGGRIAEAARWWTPAEQGWWNAA